MKKKPEVEIDLRDYPYYDKDYKFPPELDISMENNEVEDATD
jgi:hypothetical protein